LREVDPDALAAARTRDPRAAVAALDSLRRRRTRRLPSRSSHDGGTILVDTPHEILVNKLGTLLNRAEPRDLIDLRALLQHGGDLRRALRDAARKDGGFSPLTVGWSLEGFDVEKRGAALGMTATEVRELDAYRRRLRDEIAALARP
jgi:hypothetical protein